MTVAIVLVLGFGGRPDSETSGLHKLRSRLKTLFPTAMIELVAENDAVRLAEIAATVKSFDWVGYIGHSFGIGHALAIFVAALRAAGRPVIDLVIAIDPVPFSGTHFIQNPAPLPGYPDCVLETLLFRTLNKPTFFTPWARDIQDASVYQRVTFGPGPAEETNPPSQYVVDDQVNHGTIDDSDVVHSIACAAIEERIAA